jgi:argininosuccinate lyase
MATGKSLAELELSEYREFSLLFSDDIYSVTVSSSLAARDHLGGTAPVQVARALANAQQILKEATDAS